LRLGLAVEIKPAMDWLAAAGESLLLPTLHHLEWLWGSWLARRPWGKGVSRRSDFPRGRCRDYHAARP
jgi:hypothetical protein